MENASRPLLMVLADPTDNHDGFDRWLEDERARPPTGARLTRAPGKIHATLEHGRAATRRWLEQTRIEPPGL